MIKAANDSQFHPECVIFDSWYASIENLKLIRSMEWHWFTRLKSNRLVNPDDTYNRPVSEVEIPLEGRVVHSANMDSSRSSKWFMVLPMSNIGPLISWMHQNLTEEHSKTVDGISKNIIGVLNSVAVLSGARVEKKRSSIVIFFLLYSHFSDWNPID